MTSLTPPTPSPDPIPDAGAPPLGPIAEPQRIVTLDVLRGFALFGIFMVNMQFFAMPFVEFLAPRALDGGPASERLAWGLVKALFEYKFISLFSLLFGVGLVVQMTRAEARGRRFAPVFLRRLVVLGLIGLVHGFLLWYGDILFLYACIGTILLFCRGLKAKTLVVLSGSIVVALLVIHLLIMGLVVAFAGDLGPSGDSSAPLVEASSADAPAYGSEAVAADDDSLVIAEGEGAAETEEPEWSEAHPRLASWFPSLATMIDEGSTVETWMEAETTAYKSGPFSNALGFRAGTYFVCVTMAVFGYGWRALSMFFMGAALMKLNFFSPDRHVWHRRFCMIGLGIGLPLELAFASLGYIGAISERIGVVMLGGLLHEVGSYAMCLGLVGAMTLLVSGGALRWLTGAMACVGRLALSNYLLQTVVATSMTYWWGMRLFGGITRVQQIALVVAIYLGQIVLSVLWLRFFTMGPLEWLWRSLTYLRPQRMLRPRTDEATKR